MSDFSITVSFADTVSGTEILRLARTAEAAGIDGVWLPEDMFFRAPMPIAGALAVSTSQVSIGFGVLTSFNRHPSLIAMEAAALAELAPGRVILGVGAGVNRRLERLGLTGRLPVEAIRDTVTIVRGMLRGDVVNHDGPVHRAVDLKLDAPLPAEPPPIYIAAMGPKSLRQAGAIGDGLILGLMASPAWVEEAAERACDGAREAGVSRSSLPIVVYLPTSVHDDPAEARAHLKPLMAFFVRRWVNVPSLAQMFTRWGGVSQRELEEMADRLAADADPRDVIPDEIVTTFCLAGRLEDCHRQIERYRAAGATNVSIVIEPDTPSPDRLIGQLASVSQAGAVAAS